MAEDEKAELAALATRQVAGTGWLPEMLRVADAMPEDPKDESAEIATAAE